MGTQFASRLTPRDTERVLAGVRTAWQTVSPERPRRGTPAGQALPPADRRRLGDLTVASVLQVAETHALSTDFRQSPVFIPVLDWLKGLVTNAKYNGFRGVINDYGLEDTVSPSSELMRRVEDVITTAERGERDAFRSAIKAAARGVVARVLAKPLSGRPNESAARFMGRRFATMEIKEVVDHYIRNFVFSFVETLLDRADPHSEEKLVYGSKDAVLGAAERMARRAARKAEAEGKLTDSRRVREIVFEELKQWSVSPGAETVDV